MNISNNYIKHRVAELTKEQCEFLVRTLEYVPCSITIVTGGIPYVIGAYDDDEEEFDEFKPYVYEEGEDVVDYVTRMAEEMCVSHPEDITKLTWQYYRATSTRWSGYKIPWDKHFNDYEKWHTNTCWDFEYMDYKNKSTAIGMETETQCASYMLTHCILPLSIIAPHMLKLYMSNADVNGVPRLGFHGIGISEFERFWRDELGGSIDTKCTGDLFPTSAHIDTWELDEKEAKQILEFMRAVAKRATEEWPEDYKLWLLPIDDEDDEEEEDDDDEWEDETETDEEQ